MKKEKIRCQKCKSIRYKIVRTHGKKSRGIKICKRCGGLYEKEN